MLRLGKGVFGAIAGAAAFGMLVMWLDWVQQRSAGVALPFPTLVRLAACAATFGLALLGVHWMSRRQQAADALELQQVREGRGFEADGGATWFLFAVPACLVLGAGGGWALRHGAAAMAVLALALLLVFLVLGWHIAQLMLRPGPMLRMDRLGITSAQYGRIPWREVVGIELHQMHARGATLHVLRLCVRDPGRYLLRAPAPTRWLHGRRLRAARVGALPIALNLLDKDAGLVHQCALALRRQDPSPFVPGWNARMEASEVEAILEQRGLDEERERIILELQSLGEDGVELPAHLTGRMAAHRARSEAAQPLLRQALAAHVRRTRSDARAMRIAMVGLVGLVVLAVALRLAG